MSAERTVEAEEACWLFRTCSGWDDPDDCCPKHPDDCRCCFVSVEDRRRIIAEAQLCTLEAERGER